MWRIIFSLFIVVSLAGCGKNYVLEKNVVIEGYSWDYADTISFSADINDTSQRYDVFLNVRHSQVFEWRNLWVKIETRLPDGQALDKRVNLVLAQPDGQWFGRCLGDNCDLRIPIQQNAIFPQKGTYRFLIAQDMRVNPLSHVKSIGMEIQKAKP